MWDVMFDTVYTGLHVRCDNGLFVSNRHRCDGWVDCVDSQNDELDCRSILILLAMSMCINYLTTRFLTMSLCSLFCSLIRCFFTPRKYILFERFEQNVFSWWISQGDKKSEFGFHLVKITRINKLKVFFSCKNHKRK